MIYFSPIFISYIAQALQKLNTHTSTVIHTVNILFMWLRGTEMLQPSSLLLLQQRPPPSPSVCLWICLCICVIIIMYLSFWQQVLQMVSLSFITTSGSVCQNGPIHVFVWWKRWRQTSSHVYLVWLGTFTSPEVSHYIIKIPMIRSLWLSKPWLMDRCDNHSIHSPEEGLGVVMGEWVTEALFYQRYEICNSLIVKPVLLETVLVMCMSIVLLLHVEEVWQFEMTVELWQRLRVTDVKW